MSFSACTIAATADIGTGVILTVVGMLVVFATLSMLGVLIALLGRWLKADEPVVAAAVATTRRTGGGVDPLIIAVLTAAATAATLQPVRLTQVKLVDGEGAK